MTPDDFSSFFRNLNEVSPFPWQEKLAQMVATGPGWPSVLALPTSAGKTATIDIAVFHLALQAGQPSCPRTAPLRIFFVVDRRIVVDEAFERAKRIANRLLQAQSGILRVASENLLKFGGEVPLHVSVMRGGMYRDDGWTRSPAQPTVCISTVDQVGSRLLFRGYGITEFKRSIHAGLIGCDSLILLDEAHISRPFLETLQSVQRYTGEKWAEQPLASPLQMVQMTATPKPGTPSFTIDDTDKAHPVLRDRLAAAKLSRLVPPVRTQEDNEPENREALAQAVVDEALRMTTAYSSEESSAKKRRRKSTAPELPSIIPARVIGVIVNRVATARRVFDLLSCHQAGEQQSCYAILLTGRVRPYDRDELLYRCEVNGVPGGWLRYVAAGRGSRDVLDKPLFVVATQTVEVGANLDFDALVTEAAPLDALRQRFGRLDRLGSRRISRAVIIARDDAVSKNADDPVYGNAISRTWSWLERIAGRSREIDFGLLALEPRLDALDAEAIEQLCSPSSRDHAPVMLPAHLDIWCQTSPTPAPDPDISLFLHGAQSGAADVQVVWRADLPEDLIGGEEQRYVDTIALVPPTTLEALPVPLWTVRRWLSKDPPSGTASDIEGVRDVPARSRVSAYSRLAVCWRGLDNSELIDPTGLRPGDTIVVPSAYGGADAFGWNPESSVSVVDVADACARLARWRSVLRLSPMVIRSWQPNTTDEDGRSLADAVQDFLMIAGLDETQPSFLEILHAIREWPSSPAWARSVASELSDSRNRRKPVQSSLGLAWLLVGRHRLRLEQLTAEASGDFTDEDDTSCLNGTTPVSLADHSKGVSDLAERFARVLRLPDSIAADLALAGWLHDLGKADLRFQIMLHRGDEIAALGAHVLLAKSGMDPSDRRAFRLARRNSGLPAGWRHECLSVELLENDDQVTEDHDRDLVLHLIGSHHGSGRALAPVVVDPSPPSVAVTHDSVAFHLAKEDRLRTPSYRLDSGWTDRFWRVTRRYGYWGLAFLEAVLRLADHRRSEQEQEETARNDR